MSNGYDVLRKFQAPKPAPAAAAPAVPDQYAGLFDAPAASPAAGGSPDYSALFDEPQQAQPEQEEPGKLESLGRGALSGLTLGFDDEIGGAVKSIFSDKTYSQERDELRAKKKRAQEANPLTYGVGEVGGGVAGALVPGLGAAKGLAGAVKAGAAMGAVAGLGSSEADLTKGDVGGALADTAKGAGVGAIGGAVGHGLGKLIERAPERVKEGVIKDLTGAQTKTLTTPTLQKELVRNKDAVLDAAEAFKLDRLARSPEKLLPKAEAALEEVGSAIGDVYKAADNASLGVPIGRVAKSLRTVAEEYESNPATRAMAKQIRSQIDDVVATWMDRDATLATGRPVAANGARAIEDKVAEGVTRRGVRVPASEVHGFVSELGKRGFAGAGFDPSTVQVMRQRAWAAVKDELTQHVEKVTPDAAKELTRLNRLYSGLSTVVDVAEERAAKDSARRAFSGVDATLAGAATIAGGGNPLAGLGAVAIKRLGQAGIPRANQAMNRALARLVVAARSGSGVAEAAEGALSAGAPRGVVEAVMGRLGSAAEQPAAYATE